MVGRVSCPSVKLFNPVEQCPNLGTQELFLRSRSLRLDRKDSDMWISGRADSFLGLHIFMGPKITDATSHISFTLLRIYRD